MHKNKILILSLIALTGITSLTACGKKQEAVIIQAQDSGKDTTTGEIIKGDSAGTVDVEEESTESTNEDSSVTSTEETNTINGIWMNIGDSSIVTFDNDYFNNSTSSEVGFYETDDKTYINVNAQKIINEIKEVDGVSQLETTYEDKEYKFKIVEVNENKMVLELDGKKQEYSRIQKINKKETTEAVTEETENGITQTLSDGQSYTVVTK